MAVRLGELLPECVATVLPMLCPIQDRYRFMSELNNTRLIEEFPGEVFELIDRTFNESDRFHKGELRVSMDRL
jgi:hypothetical protein